MEEKLIVVFVEDKVVLPSGIYVPIVKPS
jgi:hypothetical protein